MIKPIIIIRPSLAVEAMLEEEKELLTNLFFKSLEKYYIPIIIFKENETNKTTFEIIGY